MKLSSGDVCEIAGIPMNTLDRWVGAGFVGPENAFEGHGRHRTYTLEQCLAVAAAACYRAEGADPNRVAGIIRFVIACGIDWLEKEMAEGRTLPVPGAMLGSILLPGVMVEPIVNDPSNAPATLALMRRLDLKAIWEDVKRKVDQLSRRPANKRGRSRKLAGASTMEV
jgi:MerR-like DNA binding protein